MKQESDIASLAMACKQVEMPHPAPSLPDHIRWNLPAVRKTPSRAPDGGKSFCKGGNSPLRRAVIPLVSDLRCPRSSLLSSYPVPRRGPNTGNRAKAMARHFPIFIDLGRSAPLVIGTDKALAAKIRLLADFAPRVDLVTGLDRVPAGFDCPGLRHLKGISPEQAADEFTGRSLVVIKTGDRALDETLALLAHRIGVPVNVPDEPAFCSFYLGSIVDRDPVVLAVSTGGYAPVLAQRLRARIEDWLPVGYGRIAAYLDRIKRRLRHLPAARRRLLQHQIIDGEAAGWLVAGEETRVDSLVVGMLADQSGRGYGGLHVIKAETGDPALLDRRQIEAIRNADVIFYPPGDKPALLHLARREVKLVRTDPEMARARATSMIARGLEVVILPSAGPPAHPRTLARTRTRVSA